MKHTISGIETMNWFDALMTFVKLAETQSFIGAARELNTTNSVIIKRIH